MIDSPRCEGGSRAGGETEAAAAAAAAATATEADDQQKAASPSSPPPPPPPLVLSSSYDDGVLDAPVATLDTLAAADVILLGAPARQGGVCGEMRLFLDSLAPAAEAGAARKRARAASAPALPAGQQPPPAPPAISLRGKVGAAFTAIGGPARGPGGAETVLQSFHATFLSHGMVVVGAPPSPAMDGSPWSTPLGAVAASGGGGEEGARRRSASSAAAAASLKAASSGGVGGVGGGASSSSSSSPSAAAAAAAAAAALAASHHVSLSGAEVRLGYSLGQWAAQVGALLHGDDDGGGGGCE